MYNMITLGVSRSVTRDEDLKTLAHPTKYRTFYFFTALPSLNLDASGYQNMNAISV